MTARERFLIPAVVAAATASWPAIGQDVARVDFETSERSFTQALTGEGGPVSWAIQEDPTSPAGAHVLVETSGDATSNRFPLAILDGFVGKDVAVSVRFKAVAGQVDRAAGLVVRLQDADNYYIARANALEDNVRFYKVVDGRRDQIAGESVEVPTGEWQSLGLDIRGHEVTVSLNGRRLFSVTDDTFAQPGGVGLWTKADSVTHFDDFVVSPAP
jgi:hypothetical protein